MKKCDCLNFCGDDKTIDCYSESCVDFHNRRALALKWIAEYVPCWDVSATHIMRCEWHAVGYLFFANQAAGSDGFVFSLQEINAERLRIGKSEFAATPQPEGDWVKCSDRLPAESDEDCQGYVWACYSHPITRAKTEPHLKNATCVAIFAKSCPEAHYWKPTGLKRPQPPKEQ